MSLLRQLAFGSALAVCACSTGPSATAGVEPPRPAGLSLRGLHLGADGSVWASGGKFVVHTNLSLVPVDTTELAVGAPVDLRDIHAFDGQHAVALAAGPGVQSRLFRTQDGGEHWQITYQNTDAEGFFDAMTWDASGRGVVIGDPVGGRFTLLESRDFGRSFHPFPELARPVALPGEHLFAASGTCLAGHDSVLWFGTGGSHSRVLRSLDGGRSWTEHNVPIMSGDAGAGVFSVAFADAARGIAVGGNYQSPDATLATAAWTDDGGQTWHPPVGRGPSGYRSAVAIGPNRAGNGSIAIAVGTNGADFSRDFGRTWQPVEAPPLHAIVISKGQQAIASGPEGRLAVLSW